MNGLFEGVENEFGMGCLIDLLFYNLLCKGIDDKGYVNEVLSGGDIGEIVDLEYVWCWGFELMVYFVQRIWLGFVWDCCFVIFVMDDVFQV